MRELVVAWAGRHAKGGDAWEELCAVYRQRIAPQVPVRELPVRLVARAQSDESADSQRERLRAEGSVLLEAMPAPALLVALDRGGEMVSSEDLAAKLRRWRDEWPHPVVFLLGSDLGLSAEVLAAARWRWSLGPLTLPHELARLVVYEQLYRALAIAAGSAYHRRRL